MFMHLELCNCDHFPNLIPRWRRPAPYALSGDPKKEDLLHPDPSVACGLGIQG
jgi:hypothetical protein